MDWVTSCKDWVTSCKDWEKRIVAKQSLMPFEPLFPEQADQALRVFNELVLVDVAGSPKMGEVTRDWVLEFVSAIFGAYNPDTGERLINEFFLLISKKNAKSTIAAGIMMTALILNWRMSAELLIIAPTKEVADNSFVPARDMINADPELKALFNISPHVRTITHRVTGATLKVVAAETDTVGGKKASYILIDELHIFGKRSNAESMLREARGGLAARPEGFTIWLTTQSNDPPAGVFASTLNYARGVRDGRIENKQFLPVIYEFPQVMLDKEEHLDFENFYITNPNLGASVSVNYLQTEFEKAKESGEESLKDFLAKHLNVEIGIGLRSNRWAGADFWLQQAEKNGISIPDLLSRCETVTFGIDGGGLDDLLGLSAVGRCKNEICELTGEKKWLTWTHAYAHVSAFERRKENAPRYQDFINDGDLTLVETIGEDVILVAEVVKQFHDAGILSGVGLDPAQISSMIDALVNAGIPDEMLIEVTQGWRLASYIKTTERKLASGVLWHGGTRLMNWCVGNAKTKPSGNNILITKQESGKSKIDPLIALFCGVALMSNTPEKKEDYQIMFI